MRFDSSNARVHRLGFVAWLLIATISPAVAAGQGGEISGRVTESGTGRPLQGARVMVAETGASAITDRLGRYRLQRLRLGQELSLRAIFLGYSPVVRRIPPTPESLVLDLEMAPRALGLDEIVVTGTAGPARVREVGHSIAQILASEIPEPIVSIDNMLAGKVAA